MRLKGVGYDAGAVMGFNWRPYFDVPTVRREFEIIKNDLHCNAVRINAQDIRRVTAAAQAALDQGLDVWFYPTLWDRSPQETLEYIRKGAAAAEPLRAQYPDKVVFCLGGELTLFMKGIVEGRKFTDRLSSPTLIPTVKAGEHNKPLNEFLAKANAAARGIFHGHVTYASLVWEKVNWDIFDYVGIDHYRSTKIEDKYIEMLKPSFSYGKPVVNTELGYATTREGIGGDAGFLSTAGLGGQQIVDAKSQFFHYKIPLLGRFIKPRLNGEHTRDEAWQASKLVETLQILDSAGIYGTFIAQFISEINPYSENPRYDLDMVSTSLVKYYEGGRRGITYPDMSWEPKESFKAVANYYAEH
jgi:hypothetical protein